MPGLPAQHAPPDLADIRARLGKRSTFEGAAGELTSLLLQRARCRQLDAAHTTTPLDAEAFQAVQRCATLLRTRYTSPAFWHAGQVVFETAIAAATTPEQRNAAATYLAVAEAQLAEAEGPAEPVTAAGSTGHQFLFEGQMSEGQEVPPRPPGLQDLLGMLINGGSSGSTDEPQAVAEQSAQQPEDRAQALEQLFAQFRGAFGDDNADGLEEALRASLQEGGELSGPPPAAKSAVKALVKETLTEARLVQLGGADVQCSVCREELHSGDEVQIMPCNDSHCFHTPCLAPWLAQHNSCPVCRYELPTDSMAYELKKERDATAAEERQGAENAISHNEFMYT